MIVYLRIRIWSILHVCILYTSVRSERASYRIPKNRVVHLYFILYTNCKTSSQWKNRVGLCRVVFSFSSLYVEYIYFFYFSLSFSSLPWIRCIFSICTCILTSTLGFCTRQRFAHKRTVALLPTRVRSRFRSDTHASHFASSSAFSFARFSYLSTAR